MRFTSTTECEEWLRSQGVDPEAPSPDPGERNVVKLFFEEDRHRSFYLAKTLVSWLGNFESCLLWINEYGIWPSSEDLHLYYRLRTSYGDGRRLREAPGHLFSGDEKADLVSCLNLAIQFGWGGHIVPKPAATRIVFSHDSWALVESETMLAAIVKEIEEMSLSRSALCAPGSRAKRKRVRKS